MQNCNCKKVHKALYNGEQSRDKCGGLGLAAYQDNVSDTPLSHKTFVL